MKTIDYQTYYDRVLAGWIGKSLGGIVGAPYECHKQFNIVTEENLWPDILYPNDDLDIQVVWLEALQELGVMPSSDQLAEFWRKHCFYVCCEYGIFINNIESGIHPPLSGTWKNPFFQASEGCPIRSEIWGFIAPGNPRLAMEYAARDGVLDHGKTAVELEQFLSAAASLAFFAENSTELLEMTCGKVPADNAGVRLFREIRSICEHNAKPYDIWRNIVRKFGSRDSTRAVLNNAFAFMALLLGGDDFKKTMRFCIQAGWDCDCSAATAGALWGVVHGTGALPEDWLERMGKNLVCACEIPHKNTSLADFAKETAALGIEVAALLNNEICIEKAPEVRIRPLPPPAFSIRESYPDNTPVLWSTRPSRIVLKMHNPKTDVFSGKLRLLLPDGVEADWTERTVELPSGDSEFAVNISRTPSGEYLCDHYLFRASLLSENGETAAERVFGLDGAEIWLVYGPYWDMWNMDTHNVCPYQNEQLTCNPGNLPTFSGDAFNTHVRPDYPYLDETRLLAEEIPEEQPFPVETATPTLQRSDLFQFDGASCCYLVREFKAQKPLEKVDFLFQADCPFVCYLDGQRLTSSCRHENPGSAYEAAPQINLTGKKQRLVIKLATRLAQFNCSLKFLHHTDVRTHAVSPYVSGIACKLPQIMK